MNDYEQANPRDSFSAQPASSATSGAPTTGTTGGAGAAPSPSASSPHFSALASGSTRARRPRLRRLLANARTAWIVAAALTCAVIGLAVAVATSPAAASGQPVPGSGVAGGPGPAGGAGPGGGGANARSGPAAGGSSGTVDNVATSSFTLTTSAGQKVTVNEASSTTYGNGPTSTSASALTKGENVLVLGTTSGTTITATQVNVEPSGDGGPAASSAAGVVPFQQGAPSTSKQDGQVPANYTEGSGAIVSGTTANKATEAALAAYPGGVVDRVVQLSNGEYEVHYIGVNWPHHIFVSQTFTVVGAD
jgi:hypothetical protein